MPSLEPEKLRLPDGRDVAVPVAMMGAEDRYEDYVYLEMLEREWKRPLTEDDRFLDIVEFHRPADRAIIVLVFWSYFETRIDRLLRQSMRQLPPKIMEELLNRNASIGARLDRLYSLLFDTTYWTDLKQAGFEEVSTLLRHVQQRRNAFAHGQPEAIDVALVHSLVASLKDEHEAWMTVFNKRAAQRPSAP